MGRAFMAGPFVYRIRRSGAVSHAAWTLGNAKEEKLRETPSKEGRTLYEKYEQNT